MRASTHVVYIIAIIAVVKGVSVAHGAERFSIEEMLSRALTRAEIILAAQDMTESRRHFKRQSAAFMNPSIEAGTGSKSVDGGHGMAYSVSLAQPFSFPGRRALREALAGYDLRISELALREVRAYVYYETMRLAAALSIAEMRADHAKERVERFALLRQYIKGRPFASPQKRMEKYIVENKIDLFSRELLRVRSEADIIWARLNTFVDLREKPAIAFVPVTKALVIDSSEIEKRASEHNTAVAGIMVSVGRKEAERSFASMAAYSDFALSAFYSDENAGGRERVFGMGLAFQLPLWDRNEGAVRGLDRELNAERMKLAFERRALRERVRAACREYLAAVEALQALPFSSFDSMHRRQAEADDAFRKGLVDFTTYMELESDLFEKHQAVFDAQLGYVEKASILLWLTGDVKNPLN